jgi:hypothetical protein
MNLGIKVFCFTKPMTFFLVTLRRFMPRIIVTMLVVMAVVGIFRLATGNDRKSGEMVLVTPAELHESLAQRNAKRDGEKVKTIEKRIREKNASRSNRQPAQFGTKPLESAAVLAVLASGVQTVEERVQQFQAMRGIALSKEELESALAFFAGKQVPAGIERGSTQWMADELMTVLRLQQPPQENLATELGKVAFQPGTDPVVRDYLMQHLGHLWEQFGAREEIEKSLWLAVASSDETTPGSALIALSRGYQRDQQEKGLDKVRQQALVMAQNPATGLAVRVTALSIAGEGQGAAVKELADSLIIDPATPLILRKVAERVLVP